MSVQFQRDDMRELTFDGEFDVVINMLTAMGYFDIDEDDVRFLTGVHRALRSGGRFFLEFINRN